MSSFKNPFHNQLLLKNIPCFTLQQSGTRYSGHPFLLNTTRSLRNRMHPLVNTCWACSLSSELVPWLVQHSASEVCACRNSPSGRLDEFPRLMAAEKGHQPTLGTLLPGSRGSRAPGKNGKTKGGLQGELPRPWENVEFLMEFFCSCDGNLSRFFLSCLFLWKSEVW
ncbi:hypothetical protein JTE90_023786 [Oedothorax gibbosus]|uniref:Uncharacterized protein n=1 Tax=Oedothorax gibbosus TaxID=931172 RepID=A0AAV6UR09_9ARAC|nr:hypothetical protein JTE90_023786 [Oedothorax gibbosus]